MCRIVNLTCSVLIVSIMSISSYSLDTPFIQKIRAEEQIAYAEINRGQIKEGLHRLVQLFREAPLDDTNYIEPLLGPFQLFCYTTSQHNELLLHGFQINLSNSKERLLEPEVYPSDRLLMVGAYASSKPQDIASKAYLYQNIPHLIVSEGKVPGLVGVGLGLLTFPEGQEVMGVSTDMYRALSIPYMRSIDNIKIKQLFLDLHVLMQLKELGGQIKGGDIRNTHGETLLLKKLNDWGITNNEVLTLSPGLNCISLGLPSMDIKDLNSDSFVLWSDMLTSLTDSQAKYILLSFLQFAWYFGEETKERVRNRLEDICKEKRSLNTVEGVFAKCILNQWDIKDHREKELYIRSKELLQTEVLPGVISPWSLYEERDRALRSAYNYFVKYCWYDYGVEIGEGMNSQNWIDIELFKREPLYITMMKIKKETTKLRYKKDEKGLEAYYLDIAEHTPNAELKAEMLALSKNPLQEVKPLLKNAPIPPVPEILLDRAKKQAEKVILNEKQLNLLTQN